mmetsp:Transcript_15084/g.19568  ORF Transcript_15084/g.19568 Transcript_15084/m.19568 type:complete len:340 (-) Transcript_15084:28-1047(-)|eukprot:CAMPEP_0114338360 /NCGR_PEP_ID=MMETSP0101-20121206/6985_1 /TAXON_ID=38822 ORGANISM="Pteridomonas danica, Strain PT" /NCGR_SAMPLE_ID=MMETSP0101 /ASSEMBLY_ACC=CAM_ASM_000211 /LENGTH=339 /DNA_ID=CAMNT_0001470917 /DNA_START=24 /DNA_END=1043 /DNA_ORIENTATION=-
MNWYNNEKKKSNGVEEKAAWERRHHQTTKPTPEQRNHTLEATYGANFDMMASNAQTRRQQWIMDALTDPSLFLKGAPEMSVNEHTFRDRTPELEIGPEGNFSSRKYVPRVFHTGGGKLNRPKTRDFLSLPHNHQQRVVNPLEPRPSTQSLMDIGTVRGRIVQPRYDERARFEFRAREPAKELHPPMHFKAKNDAERICTELEQNTVNDSGAWNESKSPSWRSVTPSKWRGQDFRANTAPSNNSSQFMNGKRYPRSQLADEPAVVHQHSVHMVKDSAFILRERQKSRDLGGNFQNITKRGERENASPTRSQFEFSLRSEPTAPRRYHKTLSSAPSSLDDI